MNELNPIEAPKSYDLGENRKLRLSINDNIIDKEPRDPRYFAEGFNPYEVTIGELKEAIEKGWAFSYQFESAYRNAENFLATDVLAVDIDGGVSIDECLGMKLVRDYGSLFYTTPSHSSDEHRFRIVFALPKTLTDPNEVEWANRALAQLLGGDMAATDAARLYFGSSDGDCEILGSELSDAFLQELLENGQDVVTKASSTKTTPTGNRSYHRIDPNKEIDLANGSSIAFKDITQKQDVHCPFHNDRRPSAFVTKDRYGTFYLHCKTCSKTWWPKGSVPGGVNFHEFDQEVRDIKQQGWLKTIEERRGVELFMEPEWVRPANIQLMKSQYLDPAKINADPSKPGVTLIKSPKGSGKTHYLADVLKGVMHRFATLEDWERYDDPEDPEPSYTDEKVLLIGHRQALIGELCQRLGLNCYLDYPEERSASFLAGRKRRYGVCLDSLWRVEGRKYDIVVIDEVEQVLGHFLSDTIGASRDRVFDYFFQIIRDARHVIALDADLGWASFNTLRMIKTMPLSAGPNRAAETAETPINIVLNEWQTTGKELSLYQSKDHLISEMKLAILAGKRVYVSSNSKRLINSLTKAIEELERKSGVQIPKITITSANSRDETVQEFIKNIKTEALKYQVILSSPSLGTGIDITFPDGEAKIDAVFGFYEGRITSHFEVDQQIARVRNPGEINVWISPFRYNFETEFEVVVDNLLRSDLYIGARYKLRWQDRQSLADEDPYLTMAALLTAKNRASLNNLKGNFVGHKELQGWDVHVVESDDFAAEEGKQLRRQGRRLAQKAHVDQIMSAKVLNEVEFRKLERRRKFENRSIAEADFYSLERTKLELFYQQEATRDLVKLDDEWRFRRVVHRLASLKRHAEDPTEFKSRFRPGEREELRRTRIELKEDWKIGAALLHEILSTTPIYANGAFLGDVEYSHDGLREFAERSAKVRKFVSAQFGVNTQSDVADKPIQHLRKLLKLMGLEQERVRSDNAGDDNKRVRYYMLDADSLASMTDYAEASSVLDPWMDLNRRYGFTYSADDIEYLSGNAWM